MTATINDTLFATSAPLTLFQGWALFPPSGTATQANPQPPANQFLGIDYTIQLLNDSSALHLAGGDVHLNYSLGAGFGLFVGMGGPSYDSHFHLNSGQVLDNGLAWMKLSDDREQAGVLFGAFASFQASFFFQASYSVYNPFGSNFKSTFFQYTLDYSFGYDLLASLCPEVNQLLAQLGINGPLLQSINTPFPAGVPPLPDDVFSGSAPHGSIWGFQVEATGQLGSGSATPEASVSFYDNILPDIPYLSELVSIIGLVGGSASAGPTLDVEVPVTIDVIGATVTDANNNAYTYSVMPRPLGLSQGAGSDQQNFNTLLAQQIAEWFNIAGYNATSQNPVFVSTGLSLCGGTSSWACNGPQVAAAWLNYASAQTGNKPIYSVQVTTWLTNYLNSLYNNAIPTTSQAALRYGGAGVWPSTTQGLWELQLAAQIQEAVQARPINYPGYFYLSGAQAPPGVFYVPSQGAFNPFLMPNQYTLLDWLMQGMSLTWPTQFGAAQYPSISSGLIGIYTGPTVGGTTPVPQPVAVPPTPVALGFPNGTPSSAILMNGGPATSPTAVNNVSVLLTHQVSWSLNVGFALTVSFHSYSWGDSWSTNLVSDLNLPSSTPLYYDQITNANGNQDPLVNLGLDDTNDRASELADALRREFVDVVFEPVRSS